MELFVAAEGHWTPAEQGVHAVAAEPPAEKLPARQALGGAPLPGHAQPGGHGTTLLVDTEGQNTPGEQDNGRAPPPLQNVPAPQGRAGSVGTAPAQ